MVGYDSLETLMQHEQLLLAEVTEVPGNRFHVLGCYGGSPYSLTV